MTPRQGDTTVVNISCNPLGDDDSPIQTRRTSRQDWKERCATYDDVPQRRASFQRSALRDLRVNQKKAFDILKEAAKKAEKRNRMHAAKRTDNRSSQSREDRQEQMEQVIDECLDCLYSTGRTSMATKIQAVFRGYLCRASSISRKRKTLRRGSHMRNCSEITMSDWSDNSYISDSFRSLGSLEISPRTHMRLNEECCCSNNNSFTSTTFEESEPTLTLQDSLSTIFSADSPDSPVKPPSRKLSPMPPGTRVSNENDQASAADLHFPLMTTKTGSAPYHDGHASFDCLRSWRPRPDSFYKCDGGNISFSSYFAKDEPVKAPERSRSPVPPSSIVRNA